LTSGEVAELYSLRDDLGLGFGVKVDVREPEDRWEVLFMGVRRGSATRE